MLDLLDQISASWSVPMAPRLAPQSITAFAATLRVAEGDDQSTLVTTPVQRAILKAWDEGWRTISVAGSVQSGKTLICIVVPTLYQITEDTRPVLNAGPTQDLAFAVWRAKSRPMLDASNLSHVLPQEGEGSRRGTPDELLCTTGCRVYYRGAGAANEAQSSLVTVRVVLVTEVDSIAISKRTVRRDGERPGQRVINMLDRRRHRYGADSRMILESTVKRDRDSLILDLWGDGTQGVVWHACPHCHAWARRDWSHVTYDPADAQTAAASIRIACPVNGCLLTPVEANEAACRALVVHRGQRIEGGMVVGPMPAASSWSIRYMALDDPHTDLGLLAQEHRTATLALRERQDSAPLRQFWRDYLTAGYTGEDAESADTRRPPEAIALASRSASSTYERGQVPFPGQLSFAIDQQERELWWLALVLDGERAAIIDAGVDYLCHRHETPTADQRRAALDRCAARAEALHIPPESCGVDAGGRGYLDVLDGWLRARSWRWWAIRGDGRAERGEGSGYDRSPGWYETFRRDDGRQLIMAEADTLKGRILSGLAADPSSPAALLLPRGLAADSHIVRHLIAEECLDGKWVKRHARNDILDLSVYTLALAKRSSGRAAVSDTVVIVSGGG